jgi:hypothetical protein
MSSTLRSASALAALWQCQRCDSTNDSAKNERPLPHDRFGHIRGAAAHPVVRAPAREARGVRRGMDRRVRNKPCPPTGGGRVSVSSQLMRVLVGVLVKTHTPCTLEWVGRFCELDRAHQLALDADVTMGPDKRGRLQRLNLQFLKKVLKWSSDLGRTRHGDAGMHALLGDHCWNNRAPVHVAR